MQAVMLFIMQHSSW